MAGKRKALRYLVIVLLLWRRYYGARNLGVGKEVVVEVQLEGYDAQCAGLFEVAQLRAPRGSICLRSDSACQDVACSEQRTVVEHLGPQQQTFDALLRPVGVWVWPDWIQAIMCECVETRGEFFSASRDVFGVEDAGSGGGYRLLEEAAVQHLHGAVHRRREHVSRGHGWLLEGGCLQTGKLLVLHKDEDDAPGHAGFNANSAW
jgi:hypothetical protein